MKDNVEDQLAGVSFAELHRELGQFEQAREAFNALKQEAQNTTAKLFYIHKKHPSQEPPETVS